MKRQFQIASVVLLGIALTMGAVAGVLYSPSFQDTRFLRPQTFKGIQPLKGETSSIVIVHGIGNHCIGYAEDLIANLARELTDAEVVPIETLYQGYLDSLGSDDERRVATDTDGPSVHRVRARHPLLDGGCVRRTQDEYPPGVTINGGTDLESVVLAQDALCRHINEQPSNVRWSCHKLYVDRTEAAPGENPEYVTGFIRRYETTVSADTRLRIYELTWSPATRWIKESLDNVEQLNDVQSNHLVNRRLKSGLINAAFADAVAYLSDSGVLVNFDVLQAFCMTIANQRSLHAGYEFACDRGHLRRDDDGDSKASDDEVFLVTHSLGTRVLFDSIGLLARGIENHAAASAKAEQGLLQSMSTKLNRIGARVPREYWEEPADGSPQFSELLNDRIPEFARAIRSIFVFTNQIPLLAANLTSPFHSSEYDAGAGFRSFLKMRMDPMLSTKAAHGALERVAPLQIVSFHDPDDLLSYNFSCWYHVSVLRHLESTNEYINKEALRRTEKKNEEARRLGQATTATKGSEARAIRDALFQDGCSREDLKYARDEATYDKIWKEESKILNLVDAAVRLKGSRVGMLAVHPLEVHSNYFTDDLVHSWLASGSRGNNQ